VVSQRSMASFHSVRSSCTFARGSQPHFSMIISAKVSFLRDVEIEGSPYSFKNFRSWGFVNDWTRALCISRYFSSYEGYLGSIFLSGLYLSTSPRTRLCFVDSMWSRYCLSLLFSTTLGWVLLLWPPFFRSDDSWQPTSCKTVDNVCPKLGVFVFDEIRSGLEAKGADVWKVFERAMQKDKSKEMRRSTGVMDWALIEWLP